ncbi:hypothetical protein ABT346_01900 [Micromonospora peucetia]|uniref:hypothetical protein n=1 Tax=Micromonospora peucetia TaxID=47871 RepID=UPI003320C3E8
MATGDAGHQCGDPPAAGRELSLHAAAIAFYGAMAVVPVARLAIWLTSLLAGAERVRRLTSYAVRTLPDAIGAPPRGTGAGRGRGGVDPAAGVGVAAAGVALRRRAAPRRRIGRRAAQRRVVGRLAGPVAAAPLLAPAPAPLLSILLWLYLFHVIVLAGYSATLALSCWRTTRSGAAGPGPSDSRMPKRR